MLSLSPLVEPKVVISATIFVAISLANFATLASCKSFSEQLQLRDQQSLLGLISAAPPNRLHATAQQQASRPVGLVVGGLGSETTSTKDVHQQALLHDPQVQPNKWLPLRQAGVNQAASLGVGPLPSINQQQQAMEDTLKAFVTRLYSLESDSLQNKNNSAAHSQRAPASGDGPCKVGHTNLTINTDKPLVVAASSLIERHDEDDDEDDGGDDDDDRSGGATNTNKLTSNDRLLILSGPKNKSADSPEPLELIQGSGSVSLESSLIPPPSPPMDADSDYSQQYSGLTAGLGYDGPSGHQHGRSALVRSSAQHNHNDYHDGNKFNGHLDSSEPSNQSDEGDESAPSSSDDGQSQAAQDEEAAARKEQEAAEASEAEAADRSALDEQQQAQREIILAQAQSEAKAIKEQQEALLKQQQLQQQILLRRHQNDLGHNDELRRPKARSNNQASSKGNENRNNNLYPSSEEANSRKDDGYPLGSTHDTGARWRKAQLRDARLGSRQQQQYQAATNNAGTMRQRDQLSLDVGGKAQARLHSLDSEFSDLPDRGNLNNQAYGQISGDASEFKMNTGNIPQVARGQKQDLKLESMDDELGGDYSMRKALHSPHPMSFAQMPQAQTNSIFRLNLTSSDLLEAAQHHYGAHFGSLQGLYGTYDGASGAGDGHKYHDDFYQFAESKKKGHFDAGFKRGGKKFQTSGHSSQHKGHAEGHVHWSAKKGKGTHYWDLKHKDNKGHYGLGGSGYGSSYMYY